MSFLKNKLGLKKHLFFFYMAKKRRIKFISSFSKKPKNILLSSYTTIILFSKIIKQN